MPKETTKKLKSNLMIKYIKALKNDYDRQSVKKCLFLLHLSHVLEGFLDVSFGCVALLSVLLWRHKYLRFLNEVKVRAGHDDLADRVSLDEFLGCITLILVTESMNSFSQLSLLFLMETIFIILVAEIVDYSLPFLDDNESSIRQVRHSSEILSIER
jgi:hypothetical protein